MATVDEQQRSVADGMLASVRTVLEEMRTTSREEWMRSDAAQWRLQRAIVAVGTGAEHLFWFIVRYPDPWWWRARRLSYGLRAGYARLDPAYLWEAIPRDWLRLEGKLQQLLDDDPPPEPHG